MIHSEPRYPLLILLATMLALASNAFSQQTGEWIVVDSLHPDGPTTDTRYIAGASHGDYVVVLQETPVIGPFVVNRTTDGGASWLRLRADSGYYWALNGIAHPSPDLIMVIGDTSTQQGTSSPPNLIRHPFLLRSTDGGSTWERQSFPDNSKLISIAMNDGTSGAILSGAFGGDAPVYSLFITVDGGATWEQRILPEPWICAKVDRLPPSGYIVTAYDPTTYAGLLLRMSDDGKTWESHPIPSDIAAIDFVDDLDGWGVGSISTGLGATQRDLIARTTDGGKSWTTVIDSLIDFRFGLSDVSFADHDHGIAVGAYGKVLRTSDGGKTWRQDWPPSWVVAGYTALTDVAYPVADEALALTNVSYILKYTGRQVLAAPKFTAPSTNLAELPLETTVEWTPIDGALSYDFQVGDTTYEYNYVDPRVFDVPYISDTGLTTTSRTVLLAPNTRYIFRVRSRNEESVSDWSVPLYTISSKSAQALLAPTFIIPSYGDTSVSIPTYLEWTASTGATGYDLMIGTNSAYIGPDVISLSNLSETHYTAPLASGTTYYARVRARNASEFGNWSNLNTGPHIFTTSEVSDRPIEIPPQRSTLMVGPNPVHDGRAEITLHRAANGPMTLALINLLGDRLATIFEGTLSPGEYTFPLDLSLYPAGLYFVEANGSEGRIVRRFVNAR